MEIQITSSRHIRQFFVFIFLACFFTTNINAQCKTFKITDQGDTLNCIDMKNKKRGKWIERTEPLRGNPGFEEEGEYINDRREGIWRKYNLMGDMIAKENYKWGLLDGTSQYFNIYGLEREESWKALDPDKEYDTIDVPDLYTDGVYKTVVVKNEGYSLKQGKWTYYDPQTSHIIKNETWVRDSLENPLAIFGIKENEKTDSSNNDGGKKKISKPAAVLDWEKKNSGKKKVKVREGNTGY